MSINCKKIQICFKQWSGFASALTTLTAVIGLIIGLWQVNGIRENQRWQNYNELNARYHELYKGLPSDIENKTSFEKLQPESKRWIRRYYYLYSEEYWLYKNDLIPKEMWTERISNGVEVNLRTYPTLIDGYHYWRAQGDYTHPKDFDNEINSVFRKLKCLNNSN
ncbi:MAG: hypothetical protein SFU25_04250 [Candidatus Caenarcaniphilales bacterium]|nr:hypothetical protein [Candidatus Caenarcaniphilales bacterium]